LVHSATNFTVTVSLLVGPMRTWAP
jgi:hypothetical protein